MVSFKFARVPQENLALDNIEEVVREWSIREGDEESGQGAIPETLNVPSDDTAYFKYGNWRTEEVEKLDGTEQVPKCEKRLMGVLGGNLFFVETASTNDYRESMVDMFEREFTDGIVLETEEFISSAMKMAEAQADDLLEVKFLPSGRMEPESITIEDRGDVMGTDAYERHEDEERRRLRMELNPESQTLKQGFKKRGVFTAYHRDLQSDEMVGILRANYELLRRMLEENTGPQRSWSSWEVDEGSDSGSSSESDD
ncbi:hypothetical protein [Halobaculum sp. MBLA0143]|uniref:hypothetical protein n=1 Tax=Halobaculum sp. MBLA0143 TaxID=3079933 RepID=UPI0035252FA8